MFYANFYYNDFIHRRQLYVTVNRFTMSLKEMLCNIMEA